MNRRALRAFWLAFGLPVAATVGVVAFFAALLLAAYGWQDDKCLSHAGWGAHVTVERWAAYNGECAVPGPRALVLVGEGLGVLLPVGVVVFLGWVFWDVAAERYRRILRTLNERGDGN